MLRGLHAGTFALLASGVAGCFSDRPATGPEPPAADGRSVAIGNFAYLPPTIAVPTGATVSWTNGDDSPHTVTADDGTSFDSPLLGKGQAFTFSAPIAGTYPYHCTVHPFMTATLIVTAP